MKTILILSVFLLSAGSTYSQSKYLSSQEDIEKHSEEVTMLFEGGDFSKAFKKLKKYWPLPENEIDQFESMTLKQFNLIDSRFGEVIGANFLRQKTVGDFLIYRTYVIRYDKHALRLMFYYYRNNNGWVINSFKWDDKITELID